MATPELEYVRNRFKKHSDLEVWAIANYPSPLTHEQIARRNRAVAKFTESYSLDALFAIPEDSPERPEPNANEKQSAELELKRRMAEKKDHFQRARRAEDIGRAGVYCPHCRDMTPPYFWLIERREGDTYSLLCMSCLHPAKYNAVSAAGATTRPDSGCAPMLAVFVVSTLVTWALLA
jgi:hypothetical protein